VTKQVINRRQLKIPREDVRQWLVNYALNEDKKKPTLKAYIKQQVRDAGYSDVVVDMGDLGEMSAADIILEDLSSHARG
jgi:vacuolar-type H+-ATPase subunit E/Vma4